MGKTICKCISLLQTFQDILNRSDCLEWPGRRALLRRGCAVLVVILIAGGLAIYASSKNLTFKIPPVKIPLKVKDQQVTITASGIITVLPAAQGANVLKLELTADLSELQQNVTDLLSAALDRDDPCGDRIAIQKATLTPAEPAILALVQLHYERWVCAKVFGKKETKKLIGGNAVMQLKLTPAVEDNGTQLRFMPEVGPIEADGSLGELLRSGNLGEMLRNKIQSALLAALQKGADLGATLPPAIREHARIQNVRFTDAGSGRLAVILNGEFQVSNEDLQALSKQVKARLPSK